MMCLCLANRIPSQFVMSEKSKGYVSYAMCAATFLLHPHPAWLSTVPIITSSGPFIRRQQKELHCAGTFRERDPYSWGESISFLSSFYDRPNSAKLITLEQFGKQHTNEHKFRLLGDAFPLCCWAGDVVRAVCAGLGKCCTLWVVIIYLYIMGRRALYAPLFTPGGNGYVGMISRVYVFSTELYAVGLFTCCSGNCKFV